MENVNARGIYTDLMREFIRRGVTPYIVIPGERRSGKPEEVFESAGAHILRVKTLNIQKTNYLEKGIGTLLLESQYMRAIKRHWEDVKFDLCMYSTPPITFNKVIAWQKKLGVPTYMLLKDIFPQNAVDLGMLSKKNPIYWLFRRKEHMLYKLSDRIGCMSPANCEFVIKHNPGVNPKKVELCPNSIEVKPSNTLKGERNVPSGECQVQSSDILTQYGIPSDRPLFIYGGNLGKPQGIDFLIEVLNRVKNREDLHICIVGSGTEQKKLQLWYDPTQPNPTQICDTNECFAKSSL